MKLVIRNSLSESQEKRLDEIYRNGLVATTTSLARVRGFTVELLYYLKKKRLRCCELVQKTMKYHAYVHRYLRNMRKYGLVTKNELFWEITPVGVDFFDYLDIWYIDILEYGKKQERSKKEVRKIKMKKKKKHGKQVNITMWQSECSLDSTEKEVVEVLVNHYNRTGSKFILVEDQYELANRLEKNVQTIMPALKKLREENIIYLYRSTFDGVWKVGLKKDFIELLHVENL